jgi:hypothetical protein
MPPPLARRALAWPFRAWAALADVRRFGRAAHARGERDGGHSPDQARLDTPARAGPAAANAWHERRWHTAAAFRHWQVAARPAPASWAGTVCAQHAASSV